MQSWKEVPSPYTEVIEYIEVDDPSIPIIHDILLEPGNGIEFSHAFYQISQFLMTVSTPTFITDLVTSFGFLNLYASLDTFYNLLWHINVYQTSIKLSPEEIDYVSGLSMNELLSLLPETYNGARDLASVLYAIITGSVLPVRYISDERYYEVINYPPNAVWKMAQIRWHINNYNGTRKIENMSYTPYELVASHPHDDIEDIFLSATIDNVENYIVDYGVVFPVLYQREDPESRLTQFLEQISSYGEVFTRPKDVLPPPVPDSREQLTPYTTRELMDAYEPPPRNQDGTDFWRNRNDLINYYVETGKGGAMWSWRHLRCQNDNTRNVVEFTLHGEIDKDDPNDPTLSYGTLTNYRCYQISELTEVFKQYEGEFRVPDYKDIGVQDFPIASIRQLQTLLKNRTEQSRKYNYGDLPKIVGKKLIEFTLVTDKLNRLKMEYDRFTVDQQYLANLFIAWVFFYGMWMRFWKGPGYEWPYNTSGLDVCIPTIRDEHVFIQNAVSTVLTINYERDPGLNSWIHRLPLIRYGFRTHDFIPLTETLSEKLEKYLIGRECMGVGGDTLVQVGYVLITRLLGWNQEGQFDDFLATMLPPLLDIERQIVTDALNRYRGSTNGEEYRVLVERQQTLSSPIELLPQFIPDKVQPSKHVM